MVHPHRPQKMSVEELETVVEEAPLGTIDSRVAREELASRRRRDSEDRKAVMWVSLVILVFLLVSAWFIRDWFTPAPPIHPPAPPPPSPAAPANLSLLP
jgi:hypothetical protein